MPDIQTAIRGVRKERKGFVISRSGSKSIVVRVERRFRHPVYGKVMKEFEKYHVHDEENEAEVGDMVRIVETRPISRMKRWRLAEIMQKAADQKLDEVV
ncbi:MAG: 30S ribosomal protein S17 [Desulfobulbaceae bacterium]|nr:30S ribosomal protein S17 [Desulfobulbaceae bacterium]